MNGEYVALRTVEQSDGYKVLQALWAIQHGKIVEAMRKAGKRGTETAWRYYAGQMEGFEIAITQLQRALNDMQKVEEGEQDQQDHSKTIEELLNTVRENNNAS